MSNCLYEATLQKISKECGCNPIKFFKVDKSFTACEGAQRHCMQRHLEDMGVERTIEDGGAQKECWAASYSTLGVRYTATQLKSCDLL